MFLNDVARVCHVFSRLRASCRTSTYELEDLNVDVRQLARNLEST